MSGQFERDIPAHAPRLREHFDEIDMGTLNDEPKWMRGASRVCAHLALWSAGQMIIVLALVIANWIASSGDTAGGIAWFMGSAILGLMFIGILWLAVLLLWCAHKLWMVIAGDD